MGGMLFWPFMLFLFLQFNLGTWTSFFGCVTHVQIWPSLDWATVGHVSLEHSQV